MKDLERFNRTQPNDVPSKPGVFAICRYISKGSSDLEILHCDESEDIKAQASKVVIEKKFDGFDKSIIYLVAIASNPKKRFELLQLLLKYCNKGK